MNRLLLSFIIFCNLLVSSISAQTPSDAFMMKKKEICFAVPYQYSSWDHYWEGSLYRDNPNLGTVSTVMIGPMIAAGIHDRINIIVSCPWIKTNTSNSPLRGESGFQDFSLWIKAKLYEKKWSELNRLEAVLSLGASLPVGGYYADYMPLSLGLGCKSFGSRAMINYFMNTGLFASATIGYDLRSNVNIDRTNYYTTEYIESNEFKMPNALFSGITLGYFKNLTRVELQYNKMNTLGGVDIRRNDMPLLVSDMDADQVGFYIQQRMPFYEPLGIILFGNQTISGKNVGKSTSFGGGILYQWNIKSKSKTINN